MTLNEWLASRYTPTDVLALGAVAAALLVGTLALAQGIEIVPGTQAAALLIWGTLFLAGFAGAVAYINQKNRESFYGSALDIEFDHEGGQIVLDEELAIKVRLFPDGVPGTVVESYGFENVGRNAEGWYAGNGDEGDPYIEVALEEAV